MDRLNQIFRAAERLTLSKNQAIILVGGRGRLERLEAEGRIRKVKRTDRQNCRRRIALRRSRGRGAAAKPGTDDADY